MIPVRRDNFAFSCTRAKEVHLKAFAVFRIFYLTKGQDKKGSFHTSVCTVHHVTLLIVSRRCDVIVTPNFSPPGPKANKVSL